MMEPPGCEPDRDRQAPTVSALPARSGLVTAGETMGLVVQSMPGAMRNGEPMTFGMGGSESNVAIGVRRLGVEATWVGRLGADPAGDLIRRELRAEQVEAIAISDPSPTGLMVRWRPTAMHGQVGYYRRDSAGANLQAGDIPDELVRRAAVFHATGITLALGAGPAGAIGHAVTVAREAGVVVAFDVNYRRSLWPVSEAVPALRCAVRGADVVFTGIQEASMLVGGADPLAAAHALEAMGPSQVLIKLGAQGCVGRIDGVTFRQAARPVTVVDTVGAGDAFAAGYLAELMLGSEPARRLATAVAAGALAVAVPGDWEGMPDRAALSLLDQVDPVIR